MTVTARDLLAQMCGERTARENARLTWLMTNTDLPRAAPVESGEFEHVRTARDGRPMQIPAEAASENWARLRRSAASAP